MNASNQTTTSRNIIESEARKTTEPKRPIFITRPQLAVRWQVSGETIKRYERRGIVRPVKIAARMLRYRLSDIEALETSATLDRQEVPA
jgi:hypothetical protein